MNETRLKVLEEKLDLTLNLLCVIYAKLEPDAPYRQHSFADGTGRYFPTDTP